MNCNDVKSSEFDDDCEENEILIFHMLITDPLSRLK